MLKLRHLFENVELAKTALQSWEHDTESLDEMLSNYRISSNAIHPFKQKGEVCFLRFAPVDEKFEKNILGELEFIDYLIANEYPALNPLPTLNNEICIRFNSPWGEYFASAFRKVSGVQIEDIELTNDVLVAYGKALGRLHLLSSRYSPKCVKWTHDEVLNWIEMTLIANKAPNIIFNELNEMKKLLSQIPMSPENYGLIHYDFEPDNVFYDETTCTCSVIDFDDGMYHWYALDIEQVFDSLGEMLEEEKLTLAKDTFIQAYQTEFPFSNETESLFPLMRRFVNLFRYTRLIRCVSDRFDDEPEWLIGLRKKLNKVIDRYERSLG